MSVKISVLSHIHIILQQYIYINNGPKHTITVINAKSNTIAQNVRVSMNLNYNDI